VTPQPAPTGPAVLRSTRSVVAATPCNEMDHASSLGLQALTIGAETRSARILAELATLDRDVSRARASDATTRFREALAQALPTI